MARLRGLRVCRFGRYDPDYARNRVLDKCLGRLGATIVHLADPAPLPARAPRLIARALTTRFDLALVGFRAHADMLFARLVARAHRVPLVFDPLISRYDEKVVDRRLVSAGSPLARWYFFTDRLGCRLADRVLLDTETHIDYFVHTFGVPRSKFRRLWLGTDDEVIRPQPRTGDETFTVFFYGRFSPIHGAEHIVRAARELERRGESCRFVMVGAGQTHAATRALAGELGVESIAFLDPVPYAELAGHMARADVCLGIFGTTGKATRVIPNKVFDGLAAARAVVTADTPAAREALVHGEHAWLVPAGDSHALADALVRLRREPQLRARLADQGYALFQRRFSIAALTREVAEVVEDLLGQSV